MPDDFGDFEEISEGGEIQVDGQEAPIRVRSPRQGEFVGIVVQRFGGNRMEVKSNDGKTRNCRVPGRYKRSLWLRPRDVVLIKPWADDDNKADIIFKYSPSAVNHLRKRGLLNSLNDVF